MDYPSEYRAEINRQHDLHEREANKQAAEIKRLRSALRAVRSDLDGQLYEQGLSQKERDEWPSIVLADTALKD